MIESTEKVLRSAPGGSGANAASGLSTLLGEAEQRLGANPQALLRQHFAAMGVLIDEDEIELFYQKTQTLEPEQLMLVVKSIAAQIIRFRTLGDENFEYSDWQSVQEIERNFLEFGLTFDEAELFALYQSETPDVLKSFRAKIHSNLRKMLDVISHEGELLPEWLEDVLDAKPGAEAVVLADGAEREAYKNLLNTMFDSHGLTNRRYLIEQVLDSWRQM